MTHVVRKDKGCVRKDKEFKLFLCPVLHMQVPGRGISSPSLSLLEPHQASCLFLYVCELQPPPPMIFSGVTVSSNDGRKCEKMVCLLHIVGRILPIVYEYRK